MEKTVGFRDKDVTIEVMWFRRDGNHQLQSIKLGELEDIVIDAWNLDDRIKPETAKGLIDKIVDLYGYIEELTSG